ncbi:MAG: hypothetical protein GY832_04410, partial [Chloroflexi bacterium]|nr:hypothetical protein [Chloroflexota bacterium]
MIDKKYRNLFIWPALGVTFILLFLTACGTLEIDIEQGGRMSSNETVSTTIALTSEQINLATSEVIATPVPVDIPTPIPAVTELHVAFVQDTEHGNNAWLWTEGE